MGFKVGIINKQSKEPRKNQKAYNIYELITPSEESPINYDTLKISRFTNYFTVHNNPFQHFKTQADLETYLATQKAGITAVAKSAGQTDSTC